MGKRRTVIEKIVAALDNKVLVDGKLLTATTQLFDPVNNKKDLPKAALFSEPEVISVRRTRGDRSFQLALHLFDYARIEQLFLRGEDWVDEILKELTKEANVDSFEKAFPNDGFSIAGYGPILVDQFELKSDLVFVSIPITVEFVDF